MNIHQRRRAERAAKLAEQAAAKAAAEAANAPLVKEDLAKMTKDELEAMGRERFNVELDKRKTKAKLVKDLLDAQ
tara:strand:- start:1000 stop:1224 length:225 start_codon:yes stop_codon:yes gene_type:complete